MTETSGEPPLKGARPRRFPLTVLAVFAVLAIGAVGVFARLHADGRDRALSAWHARLAVVADARKAAVENWLAERRADAEILAWDHGLVSLCAEPACPRGLELSGAQTELDNLMRFQGLLGAILYSPSGQELLVAEGGMSSCPKAVAKVHEVTSTGRFLFHDIHPDEGQGELMMGFLAPVFRRVGSTEGDRPRDSRVLGVVGLFVDPARRLFPLVSGGTAGEPGLDVYLVRREGPGARILSPPSRTRGWKTLGLQAGRDAVEVAALGSTGRGGTFTDYRGAKVLAAVRWIPEPGWGLVATVDEDVALEAWLRQARQEAALGALGILCFALLGVALWRAWSVRRYRALLGEVRDREERLRALAFGTDDLIFIKDRQERYQFVNPATVRLLGVEESEALGKTTSAFLLPGNAEALTAHDREVLTSGRPYQGEEEIPVGGEPRTFLSARVPIRDAGGQVQGVAGMLRDITERKRAEEATARQAQSLLGLYRLSEVFALAFAPDRVLDAALEEAAEALGLDGVGVFLCRPEGGLSLAAHRNFSDVLGSVVGGAEPRGVTGRVFRTSRAEFVEDYRGDPEALPQEEGVEGIVSVASIPVQAQGRLLGVLTAGYLRRHSFQVEERGALEALGHMMGVALSRAAAQGALAEEAAERRRAEQRLRRLYESTAGLTGRHLFTEVARALFEELGARWVEVTEVAGDLGRPLVAFEDGGVREPVPFCLLGTPCGEVAHRADMLHVEKEAWRLFPDNPELQSRRVEFYVGSPLLDSRGVVIGVLCAYGGSPRPLSAAERDLMGLYARRVAGEVERVQNEERLGEARRALDTVIQNLPGAVYRSSSSPRREIEYVSPGCGPITGHPPGAFGGETGLSLFDLVLPEDRSRVAREIEGALAEGRPYEMEYRIHDQSGAVRWVYDVGRSVAASEGGRALEGVLLDHTVWRTLEAQLTHSQRMEALGRLAGGVAHDFNNLLTAISGYSELLLGRLPVEDRSHRAAREIGKAADRAADLTRQLLAFSRRQAVEPKILDFNEAVSDTLQMLGRLLGEDVELLLELGSEVGAVRADPSQLEQVVLNLCVNARDAMPGGGRLTVRTTAEVVGAEGPRGAGGLLPGQYAVLEVLDTGTGMPPEVLEHVFEPFFTTKEEGKGTGLGLATVYGVVAQAGGRVAVASTPGQGTTFRVLWPRHQGQVGFVEAVEAPGPRPGDGRRVLLAEDEASVRELAAEFLEELGYAVRVVASGEEATEAAGPDEAPDVLVTDVVMPGMNGPDLARALRRDRPGLPVVFISGHTGEALLDDGILRPGSAFLQKPFRLADLARALETALKP